MEKHGHWEQNPNDREWDVCSVCHVGTKRREYGIEDGREWVVEHNYKYCPRCGAKMDGEQNG